MRPDDYKALGLTIPRGLVAEEDIAKVAVEHFRAQGCTVYQEVQYGMYGKRADIVVDRDGSLHVIEVKTSFSEQLICQAITWKVMAEYVSVAVPFSKSLSKKRMLQFCKAAHEGLGVLYVRGNTVEVASPPRKNEINPNYRLRDFLCEEQKDYAPAGNADSRFVTGFQLTCKALAELVAANPGIAQREAIGRIEHHYASDSTAYSALSHWIAQGSVRGVKGIKEKGRIRLYPKE